jgi:hypothetical protein
MEALLAQSHRCKQTEISLTCAASIPRVASAAGRFIQLAKIYIILSLSVYLGIAATRTAR